jgi:hypothetical protein
MLTINIDATQELDLVLCHVEHELRNLRWRLAEEDLTEKDRQEISELIDSIQSQLASYKPNESIPKLIIGYIPIAKLTELNHALHKILQEPERDDFLARVQAVHRDYMRWGVRGHANLDIEYKTESARLNDRSYDVAEGDALDVYERLGLSDAICTSIIKYNSLDETKKKLSSFLPGPTRA